MTRGRTKVLSFAVIAVGVAALGIALAAQQAPPVRDTLGDGPFVFDTTTRGPSGSPITGPKFRVVVTKGLNRPYSLVFLPDGDMLITERGGRLRIMRKGVLDPQPIAGIPEVLDRSLKGLNDLALHPKFADNHWLYFTYYKPTGVTPELATAVLARARYDGGSALSDVRDIFTTDTAVNTPSAARIAFGRDGKIFLAIGIPIPSRGRAGIADVMDAQDPNSYFGKVL